jgi:hypothetical protein
LLPSYIGSLLEREVACAKQKLYILIAVARGRRSNRALLLIATATSMTVFAAAAQSAAADHKTRVPARLVYITGELHHLCYASYGIEYGNVPDATYDVRFINHPGNAASEYSNVRPQAVQDAVVVLAKPSPPPHEHFWPLAGGGGTASATTPHCVFEKNPYAGKYSNVSVYAVVP